MRLSLSQAFDQSKHLVPTPQNIASTGKAPLVLLALLFFAATTTAFFYLKKRNGPEQHDDENSSFKTPREDSCTSVNESAKLQRSFSQKPSDAEVSPLRESTQHRTRKVPTQLRSQIARCNSLRRKKVSFRASGHQKKTLESLFLPSPKKPGTSHTYANRYQNGRITTSPPFKNRLPSIRHMHNQVQRVSLESSLDLARFPSFQGFRKELLYLAMRKKAFHYIPSFNTQLFTYKPSLTTCYERCYRLQGKFLCIIRSVRPNDTGLTNRVARSKFLKIDFAQFDNYCLFRLIQMNLSQLSRIVIRRNAITKQGFTTFLMQLPPLKNLKTIEIFTSDLDLLEGVSLLASNPNLRIKLIKKNASQHFTVVSKEFS